MVTLLSTVGTGLQPMRISRWSARLMNYNYTVTYKRGHDNTVADALSRLPMDSKEKCEQDSDFHSVCSVIFDSGLSEKLLQSACESDEVYKAVVSYVTGFWPDKRNLNQSTLPYFPVRDELTVHNGIIFRDSRVVVPSTLQSQIVDISHEGHQGVVRTKQRLRQLYWWPKMDKLVYEKIKNCVTCQLHDKSAKPRTAPMQPVSLPSRPWQKVTIDIVGPNNSVPYTSRFAITLIDYYSKWPEVAFASTVTTDSIIDFLLSIFSREGYPEELVSDNGSQFISVQFRQFLAERNIKHTTSAIYHPEGNSEIERFNRVFSDYVKTALMEHKEIQSSVREFLAIYRCTPHATAGQEPSVLLHKRHLRTKLDITGVTKFKPSIKDSAIREYVQNKQKKSKDYYDQRKGVKIQCFQPGDLVRIKKPGYFSK